MRPYDRALALGEVVDHTLNGLGLEERRDFLGMLQQELGNRSLAFELREGRVRQILGDRYAGTDISLALHGEPDTKPLEQLRKAMDGPLSRQEHAEVTRHWQVLDWLASGQGRYGEVDLGLLPEAPQFRQDPLAYSEFFDQSQAQLVSLFPSEPPRVDVLGNPDAPEMRLSMVLEGGGGKGLAYPEVLEQLRESLSAAEGRFGIDEFTGTSAGAITALFLAAGFKPEELKEVMEQVDFNKFNSDAAWLMGGVDPKVRGINRTGLFSMQKMYRTLYELLSKKLGIQGRPVLFRDLPFKLNVVGTVMNTDLPETDPLRQSIDPDGRMVMSPGSTPNFDVVGAVLASAAVPGFFNAPQMEVAREVEVSPGHGETRKFRIQFVDGGVVDNLSLSSTQESQGLVVLPTHFAAVDPETGERKGLDTLNFDSANLDVVDAHNHELYGRIAPGLSRFLSRAREGGVQRTVLALNLTSSEEMASPALQGRSPAETTRLTQLARASGLDLVDTGRARSLVEKTQSPPDFLTRAAGFFFDNYVDGTQGEDNQFHRHGQGSRCEVGEREEETVFDVVRGAGSAALASSQEEFESRRFEGA